MIMSEASSTDGVAEQMQRFIENQTPPLESLDPEAGVERYLKSKSEVTANTRSEYRRKLGYLLQYCEIEDIGTARLRLN
jgi:hypothetical protein